ncbi:MAG: hypothetical protein JXR37_21990 [Kiritimatiellae bacterium]|nr:hypothetical protein [Kiritimatiellia bacterium]
MMQDIGQHDREVLRGLATQIAEIAAQPVQRETAAQWRALNDLRPVRPMVYVYQIPWHEMDVDGELALQATDEFCRGIEWGMRRALYQWNHMRVDQVVDPVFACSPVVRSTGYGLRIEENTIAQDTSGGIRAHHYHNQIQSESDVDKIKTPVVTLDTQATEARRETLANLFGDILPVRVQGRTNIRFSPWDRLTTWWNPQQVLMDLILNPALVHKAMDRLTTAMMSELDQIEQLGLLSIGNGNLITGEGGLGFTADLPRADPPINGARAIDLWGSTMAQIFSEVSPQMHEEFALQYEKRLMARCGLCYYGCCEPLHRKIEISAKHLPRMRKISMSPWVDPHVGAETIGNRFVFSFKPNPAFLATDGRWDRASARREIEAVIAITQRHNCPLEIILKDISTVRHEPRRLWEWTELVMELVGCERLAMV